MADESREGVVRRVCAWCGDEFARETWFGESQAEITTWGICRRCLRAQLYDDAVRNRVRWARRRRKRPSEPPQEVTHSSALAGQGSGERRGREP